MHCVHFGIGSVPLGRAFARWAREQGRDGGDLLLTLEGHGREDLSCRQWRGRGIGGDVGLRRRSRQCVDGENEQKAGGSMHGEGLPSGEAVASSLSGTERSSQTDGLRGG